MTRPKSAATALVVLTLGLTLGLTVATTQGPGQPSRPVLAATVARVPAAARPATPLYGTDLPDPMSVRREKP